MKKSYSLIFLLMIGITPIAHAQVDYATQIQPIFNANCTSCHGGNSGLTLTSFEALMGSTGIQYGSNIVVPGDPDASGLVDKIEPNPQSGNRMPTGGQLQQNEIDLIRQWITEGANATATSNEVDEHIPANFRLVGNYPNPFNPTTQIQFELPQSAQYTISIYSVHGQLLMEEIGLANAGLASITVDLRNNPTGVYIYQVRAVVDAQTRVIGTGRMTLIK